MHNNDDLHRNRCLNMTIVCRETPASDTDRDVPAISFVGRCLMEESWLYNWRTLGLTLSLTFSAMGVRTWGSFLVKNDSGRSEIMILIWFGSLDSDQVRPWLYVSGLEGILKFVRK
ncbi:hypothetical protein AVEN_43352-1 [Araneus ventricosus]|uniref:Uncharacterized protein n=1 Tax=Araneus ventricosus TaxID=182803 RepID=A0A4Y2FHV9_ARAVE|nr:hypothetical protein AVEN_43352-1 [Araneus ventricosus]